MVLEHKVVAYIRRSKPDYVSDINMSLSGFGGATTLCKIESVVVSTSYTDSPSSQGMRREYSAFGSSTFSIS